MRRVLPLVIALVLGAPVAGAHPVPNSWREGTALPGGREGAAGAFIGGTLYVSHGFALGSDSTDTIEYDPLMDTWTPRASAEVARSELVGVGLGRKLYAIGGRDLSGANCSVGVCKTLEIYDPSTDTWSLGAPMPTARAGLGAAAFEGKIYAVGGRNGVRPGAGAPLATLEVYDPVTDTWKSGPPMPTPRMDVYATVAFERGIWVIGGYNEALGGYLSTVEIFDPIAGQWIEGPPMPTPRSNAIAGVCDGDLFVVGGAGDAGKLTTVERYHGQWEAAVPLPKPGNEFAAGAVSEGGLVVAAGSGLNGEALDQNLVMECSPTKVRIESGSDEYVNGAEASSLLVTGSTLPNADVLLDLQAANGGALAGNTLAGGSGAFSHGFGDVHGVLVDGPIGVRADASVQGDALPPAFDGAILDVTPPTITFVGQEPPPSNGWNNTPVTFTWTCTDATSGPESPTVQKTVATSGTNQSVTGTCRDLAGNSSSDRRTGINIDLGKPACVVEKPVVATDSLTGLCGDDLSRVARVEVSFSNRLGDPPIVLTASCAQCDGQHNPVIWLQPTTGLPTGVYDARARGVDFAGNVGDWSTPFMVVVLGRGN